MKSEFVNPACATCSDCEAARVIARAEHRKNPKPDVNPEHAACSPHKTMEFPLFHVGWATDMNGERVDFTPTLLSEMARNSNYVLKSGVLTPPIKYSHPAFGAPDKENHGKFLGFDYRGGSLFAYATNFSKRLRDDKAREAILSYSGEFKAKHEYPDPDRGMQKIGPTVVGLGILGSERPAMWNLKPLAQFKFSEDTSPVEAFETIAELQKSGLLADYVEGAHFFGEVTNDERRFFSEEKPKEQTMTDAEIQALVDRASKTAADAAVAAAVAPLQTKITEQNALIAQQKTDFDTQVTAMSETSKRKTEAHEFCEKVFEKKVPGVLFRERAEDILADASFSEPQRTKVKGLIEAAPAGMVEAGRKGEGDGKESKVTDEPEALADLKPKHFADQGSHQSEVIAGVNAFGEFKPNAFKGIENDFDAKIRVTAKYVRERDIGAAN